MLALAGCAPPAEPASAASRPASTIAVARGSSETGPDVPLPPRSDPPARSSVERTATDAPPTHIDASGCRIPWDFVPDDLLSAVAPDPASRKNTTARILTWLVEVDDRPLLIDRAILWVHHHPTSGGDAWQLVHFYRHPLEQRSGWEVARVYDAPYVGQQPYSSAPTAQELDVFLGETWWRFEPTDGFRLLDAGVCAKAWTGAIGSAPNHHYP
jgi:hypothetical protein